MNGLVIGVSAEGSSGIDVALSGSVPEKDRIFLNEYGKAFLQYDRNSREQDIQKYPGVLEPRAGEY